MVYGGMVVFKPQYGITDPVEKNYANSLTFKRLLYRCFFDRNGMTVTFLRLSGWHVRIGILPMAVSIVSHNSE